MLFLALGVIFMVTVFVVLEKIVSLKIQDWKDSYPSCVAVESILSERASYSHPSGVGCIAFRLSSEIL